MFSFMTSDTQDMRSARQVDMETCEGAARMCAAVVPRCGAWGACVMAWVSEGQLVEAVVVWLHAPHSSMHCLLACLLST